MRRTQGRPRTGGRPAAPPPKASAGSGDSAAPSSPDASRSRRRSQVLPEGGDPLVDQLSNRPFLVAERLVIEAHLREPLLELPLDNLAADGFGLLAGRLVGQE